LRVGLEYEIGQLLEVGKRETASPVRSWRVREDQVNARNPRDCTTLQNNYDPAVGAVAEGSRSGYRKDLDFRLFRGAGVEVVEQLASDLGPIVDGNRCYLEISGRSLSQSLDAPGKPQTSLQVGHIRAVAPVFGP